MKRLLITSALFGFVGVVLLFQPVAAQEAQSTTMTDTHMQRIQQNCGDALRTIQQIHVNDGPLRVNRGQLYDSISTKIMAGFNGRLTSNKFDATPFVKLTSQYDKALSAFRTNYKQYDDQMSAVLAINCNKQPVAFYDAVTKARQLREMVHTNIVELNQVLRDYDKSFEVFHTQFKSTKAVTK
jgi:hypothetical protein